MSAIGIDLGTTYSCVGVFRNGRVDIIANEMGNRTTPSVVAFTDEERLVGDAAKNQAAINPQNTIFDAKRLIGRKFTDSIVQDDIKHWPFKVIQAENGAAKVEVTWKGEIKNFTPEQISAMILIKMKEIAQGQISQKIKDVVITVPAYFNDGQRQATRDAGIIAGLNVTRIINEPTAAAIAFGLNNHSNDERHVLVFDLGGGTFDVSLLDIEDDMYEVRATSGDTHLGGEDFDNRLVQHLAEKFKSKTNCDLTQSPRAMRSLRTACERAKRTLSNANSASVFCECIFEGRDLVETVSKAMFENLNDDLFRQTLIPVNQVLKDANMSKAEVTDIVMVGGSTRIPKVQELLQEFFNGKKPKRGIDPDEAVAYGAAVQAAQLSGDSDRPDFLLIDIAPLSLGIETAGKVMTTVIPRGTKVPCKKEETFSTFVDNQPSVTIRVFEGERARTQDNNLLGSFDLSGIQLKPRGVPQIKVSFDVDTNGIMHVSASENGTQNSKMITLKSQGMTLSAEEIERMKEESEQFQEEDQQFKKCVNAKNEFEGYCLGLRNSIQTMQIDQSTKEELSSIVKEGLSFSEMSTIDVNYEYFERKKKEIEMKVQNLLQRSNPQQTPPTQPRVEEPD